MAVESISETEQDEVPMISDIPVEMVDLEKVCYHGVYLLLN